MPTINKLSAVSVVSGSDLLPIYSAENGDARKASLNVIKNFVEEDFELQGGLLAISSIFGLRKTVADSIALTADYQNIADYDSSLITPSDRISLSASTVIGEFVATRDISHIQFWVTLTGTWPANRDLSLAVLVGTDAAPYESSFKYVGAGRGPGNVVTASFSGPAANLNNGGNLIREGEKVKLVAKFNIADTLELSRLAFVVQTLDGI
jgi:hypothetical protein